MTTTSTTDTDRRSSLDGSAVTATPRRPWIALVIAVIGMLVVVLAGIVAVHDRALTMADLQGDQVASTLHDAILTGGALVIGELFQPQVALLLAVLVALAVGAASRNLLRGVTVLVAIVGPYVTSAVVKSIVARHRPDPALLPHPIAHEADFSYPSGHTAFATALALTLILVAFRSRWRIPALVLGIAGVLITAASRVYLGLHYPLDVTASIVWSSMAMLFVLTIWNRWILPRVDGWMRSRRRRP